MPARGQRDDDVRATEHQPKNENRPHVFGARERGDDLTEPEQHSDSGQDVDGDDGRWDSMRGCCHVSSIAGSNNLLEL